MKMLLVVLSLLVGSAFAAEVKVLDVENNFRNAKASTYFYVKAGSDVVYVQSQVEEAWVYGDNHPVVDFYRQRVPGLAYNPATKLITYTQDGVETVCAKVVPRGGSIFRHNRIYNKNCSFKSDIDFRRVKVYLVTK